MQQVQYKLMGFQGNNIANLLPIKLTTIATNTCMRM